MRTPLQKGDYAPSGPNDLRSPCPLINCLANHGHLPRDGRDVRVNEVLAGMNEIGLSTALGHFFSNPIFQEYKPPGQEAQGPPPSFWTKLWSFLRDPWVLFSIFGMRRPCQQDSMGNKVLNLDQLATPNVVEHDISLTRRDHQQGDNNSPQPDLVKDLLASSSDGKYITAADFANLRRRRIAKQNEVNPGLNYGSQQHTIACTEISLVLDVFGDGDKVPCEYARAFFAEERLPIKEGWQKRKWWTLGLLELRNTVNKVTKLVGLEI